MWIIDREIRQYVDKYIHQGTCQKGVYYMERHQLYLEHVKTCLKKAKEELEQKLEFRDLEIGKMQDYYWENYTELDEYGYEKQDHVRLFQEEQDAREELKKKYHRYSKMLSSPYFASVSFRFDGECEEEEYYIGIGDFSPNRAKAPLVLDWRAPVSGLYYDYDCGAASFEAPMGKMTGELVKKYQYNIKNGVLLHAIESNATFRDDVLQEELSKNAQSRLKSIVNTIQKEQNAIIRNEKDRILVIQGSAGSGKTSVALHRIAYLLYHHRDNLSAGQILILSPNPAFSEYISHILPELGEQNILEMSLDMYAYRQLKHLAEAEDRYEYLERVFALSKEERKAVTARTRERHSKEFAQKLQEFVLYAEDDLLSFRDFQYKKMQRTKRELCELFYEKFPDIPVLARMQTVADYIIDEEETLTGKELDVIERGIVEEKCKRMYETTNLVTIYRRFLERIGEDWYGSTEGTIWIPYEDVYAMLYLNFLLYGFPKHFAMKHLLIDEMQDYSYLQFLLISKLFSCPMTILGDKEQSVDTEKHNTGEICRDIFGRQATQLELKKSYRSTTQIMEYANRIAGITDSEVFAREGNDVESASFATEDRMLEALLGNLMKEQESKHFATTAVLTTTMAQAERVEAFVKSKMQVQRLTAESHLAGQGIVVTTFYLAKGLEFDSVHAVYVPEEKRLSDYERRILYIEATRALHEFRVYGVNDGE